MTDDLAKWPGTRFQMGPYYILDTKGRESIERLVRVRDYMILRVYD